MNRITKALGIVSLLIAITVSTTYAAPARYECDDLDDYQVELMSMVPLEDMMTLGELLEQDVETMRPSELREMSRITEEWAEAMEDFPVRDIPYAATDYHEAFTETISLVSVMTNAIATGGLFAALPYVDLIDEADIALTSAIMDGERMCGEDWPFGEDEGTI
jgi:hypothetical protein